MGLRAERDPDGDGREHPDLFRSPLRTRPWEHYPAMASLSAHACNVLARGLRWLDPVDAHQTPGRGRQLGGAVAGTTTQIHHAQIARVLGRVGIRRSVSGEVDSE